MLWDLIIKIFLTERVFALFNSEDCVFSMCFFKSFSI